MKLNYSPFVYPELTIPNGPLPRDMGAQACWYFYCACENMRDKVGAGPESQIILDNELWMDKRYEALARSVATMYSLESPADFERYWPAVRELCVMHQLPAPRPEYTRAIRTQIVN